MESQRIKRKQINKCFYYLIIDSINRLSDELLVRISRKPLWGELSIDSMFVLKSIYLTLI